MYIKRVVLTNIRCFKELKVDFEPSGQSILICADNGDGKTALLQSVAMGLCDQSSAAGLFRELPGDLIRRRQRSATIEVILQNERNEQYRILTTIERFRAFERLKQEVSRHERTGWRRLEDPDDFPWTDIFVCGYGPGREVQGNTDLEEYLSSNAVYTLFQYYEPLQNAELAMHRLIARARERAGKNAKKAQLREENARSRILGALRAVLDLGDKDDITFRSKGFRLKGRWGVSDLRSCGDGYRSMTTWVLDLLTWRMVTGNSYNPKLLMGIVLVDEIEQHLHPRWQINVMRRLTETFPRLQFIVTTHSPLVASGCSMCPVHSLQHGRHEVKKTVHGWLAEDVYREVMGIRTSRAPQVLDLVEEFEQLHLKDLRNEASASDRSKLNRLKAELGTLPGTDPVVLATELVNLRKDLERRRREAGE